MLRPPEQRLLELARRVSYGTLQDMVVQNGELVPGPPVKIKHKLRLGKINAGRCVRFISEDFKLKKQHIECIERIRGIKNGTVSIEVRDGLPVDIVVEEEITM